MVKGSIGNIRKGVRRGFFIEEAITMLNKETEEIKLNGKSIHCIRFVDNIGLVANLEIEMNKILLSLTNFIQKFKGNQEIGGKK